MEQLTVRGFDKALARRIREVAKREGLSLNQAAVMLLRRGAQAGARGARAVRIGDSLDNLIGTWSKQEEEEFLAVIRPLEKVDAEFWK
jgi:hypothetical protein